MHPRKILYKVLLPSTEFEREAHWCDHAIRYVYYRDGELYRSGIRFHRVAAMRTRAERCCKAWHIDAYDMLVEVDDSPWVAEIRGDTQEIWRDTWQMRHFMIYLDSAGCFEVIAESWEALPEEPGTWV